MILSGVLAFIASHITDRRIDELFPVVGGSTNLTARYALGGLLIWMTFAILTSNWPEPWKTAARKDVGTALLCVGVGVSLRRIWGAL